MAEGGSGPGVRTNVFEARMKTDLAGVSATLTLLPYKGNRILVNGSYVIVPDAGMTRGVGDNLITGTGADSGGAPAASTVYNVYVSNAKAAFSPSSIRLSATAPSTVRGVKYLGSSGDALNWRFVGWVRTNATPNFEFSTSNGWIVNYYNRLRLPLMANPGYVDNDAANTYQITSTTYVELNGGVDARINFLSNGEDEVHAEGQFVIQDGPGYSGFFGLGIDTVAGPEQIGIAGPTVVILNSTIHTVYDNILSAGGNHFIAMLGLSNSGAIVTVFADFQRDGAPADPRSTLVRAFINA